MSNTLQCPCCQSPRVQPETEVRHRCLRCGWRSKLSDDGSRLVDWLRLPTALRPPKPPSARAKPLPGLG